MRTTPTSYPANLPEGYSKQAYQVLNLFYAYFDLSLEGTPLTEGNPEFIVSQTGGVLTATAQRYSTKAEQWLIFTIEFNKIQAHQALYQAKVFVGTDLIESSPINASSLLDFFWRDFSKHFKG